MTASTRALLLGAAFGLTGCSTTRDTDAPRPASPAPAVAACNVEALEALAAEVEQARAAWTPAAGRVLTPADRIAAGLTTACTGDFLAPYRPVLEVLQDRNRASSWPVYDDVASGSLRACERLEAVATSSHNVHASERAGVLFDGCDLSRFSSVIDREEFIDAGANTGAIAVLALDTDLRAASVPPATADTLTRALVLESGPRLWVPDEIRLPAAAEGRPVPEERVVLALTADAFAVDPGPSRPLEAFGSDAVFDAVSVRNGDDAKDSRPWVLQGDRDVPYARVQEVLVAFEKAGSAAPPLLVLVASQAAPYRVVAAPSVSPEVAALTLGEVLARAP